MSRDLEELVNEAIRAAINTVQVGDFRDPSQQYKDKDAAETKAELLAAIAELQRDARRYRWLRDKHISNDWGSGSLTFRWEAPTHGGGNLEGTMKLYRDSLDAAIDAAVGERS